MTAATDSARTDAAAQGWRKQSCSAVVLQDTKSTHSSALLASCRAQSSSAARVRKGAPSAQAVSLFAARSSQRKHSMRRKAFHLSPAQRKKIFNGWSEGPFQVEGGEAEKGSGKCAQMARPIIRRSYLQCLGPLGFPVGMPALVMALGVLLQCYSSWPVAAVSLHTAAAAVSVLAAAAAIAAAGAATRDASASLSAATI